MKKKSSRPGCAEAVRWALLVVAIAVATSSSLVCAQSNMTKLSQPSTSKSPQPSATKSPQPSASRSPQPSATKSPQPSTTKSLRGFLAKSTDGVPTTTFTAGAPKIYVFWKGDKLKAGDRVGVLWIAEDMGYVRKDRKITEGYATAYKPDDDGAFSLARPDTGWPLGKYRVELYVGEKLATTLKFTIEEDVTVQVR